MKKISIALYFIILLLILFWPFYFISAQTPAGGQSIFTRGLVPCKGLDCTSCDIFKLISNLLALVWEGAATIAAFALMYGGFLYFRNKPAEAKKVLTNTVIGIGLAFFAWIGVDTVIKLLATGKFGSGTAQVPIAMEGGKVRYGPWNKIECQVAASAGTGGEAGLNKTNGVVDLGTGPAEPVTPYETGTYTHANACTEIKAAGVSINGDSCNLTNANPRTSLEGIHKETIHAVEDIHRNCNCTTMITGGTESGHSAGDLGHGSGYKVDLAANDPLSGWILTSFDYIGTRSDGARLYSNSRKCIIYADERNISGVGPHWDILVKPDPPATPTNPYPPCS